MTAAANVCHEVHADEAAIMLTRVGGSATATDATLYREKAHWRRGAGGQREQVWTRKAVLASGTPMVPVGSVFSADGNLYTVDQVTVSKANGTQSIHGTRTAASTVSRDSYHRR